MSLARCAMLLGLAWVLCACSGEEATVSPAEGRITATDRSQAAPAKEGDQFVRYNSSN